MIEVSLEFAVYFYLISTFSLFAILWFMWHSKKLANWNDFRYKGRQPIRNCKVCQSKYIDSNPQTYSECPICHSLNDL